MTSLLVSVKFGYAPSMSLKEEEDFLHFLEVKMNDYLPMQTRVSNFRLDDRYLYFELDDTIEQNPCGSYVQGIATGFLMAMDFEVI